MKKLILSVSMCFAVVATVLFCGCVPHNKYVESVTLNKSELTLIVGDSYTLIAEALPVDAVDKDIEWSSEDPNIVSVDSGVVTAISAGETKVIAGAGNKWAECRVTVNERVYSVQNRTFKFESCTTTISPDVHPDALSQLQAEAQVITQKYKELEISFKDNGTFTESYILNVSPVQYSGVYSQDLGNISMTFLDIGEGYGEYSATTLGDTLTLTVVDFHHFYGLTCVFTMKLVTE